MTTNSTGFKLNKLYYLYNRFYPEDIGKTTRLPKAGWRLLVALASSTKALDSNELAAQTGMVVMSVSRGLNALLEMGYIEFVVRGSGRLASTYQVTDYGYAKYVEVSSVVYQQTDAMFATLGPGGEEKLSAMFDLLIEHLTSSTDDSAS